MAGFANDATGQDVVYANNVDFSGNTNVAAQMTTNGQLLIGSTSSPHIQPGTLTSPDGTIAIGYSAPNITIDVVSGTAVVETLTGNTGGAIAPVAGNINTVGTGSITVVGSGNTLTTELTGLTNHAVQVGAGTSTLTQVGPSSTAGQVLQSQGSTTDPAFSTATYPSTTTASQILYSSSNNVVAGLATANDGVLITSSSGAPSWLAAGTTGQVLKATTGSPPSWGTPASSGITTINGDSGSITGSTVTIYANNAALNAGSSVSFVNSGATSTFNLTDVNNNTLIGKNCGNLTITGSLNSSLGYQSLKSLTSGNGNTAQGNAALTLETTGIGNTSIGSGSMANANGSSVNTALGIQSLKNLLAGSFNIAIGDNCASSYTSSESSNILLNNIGVIGESNVIRIGAQGSSSGQQNACFVAGIVGTTVSNSEMVTINSSTGQMGVAPFTTGTFTPALAFGGSATGITYTTQTGFYTRIGNVVICQFQIVLSSKGAQTGNATITGFPISAGSTSPTYNNLGFVSEMIMSAAGDIGVLSNLTASTTTMNVYQWLNSGGSAITALNNTNFTNTSGLGGSFIYLTV